MAAALDAAHANESADGFAHRLGLRNRHQLNRLLRRHRLPTYRVIAAVGRLAGLLEAAHGSNRSLCSEMMAEGIDPAWAYRAVRRLTGRPWKELRHLSTAEFINTLINARVDAVRADYDQGEERTA
jgi:hypothetical protein